MSTTAINSEKIIVKPEIIQSEIVLSHQELKQQQEKYLKQIQKNIALPGFRPGKVPASIIQKKYAATAYYEGFENLLKDKTNEVLKNTTLRPLYYVYDFQKTGVILDDGKDKTITIEMMAEPESTTNIKDKELELINFQFTDHQKKIYADYILLFNFLNHEPTQKLENFEHLFLLDIDIHAQELEQSQEDEKKKKAHYKVNLNNHQFHVYGLVDLLPAPLTVNETYTIDVQQWLNNIKKQFSANQSPLAEHLSYLAQQNINKANIIIQSIYSFPNPENALNKERIIRTFNIKDENISITLDLVMSKIYEVIDIVAEYFSGMENIKTGNEFIKNLLHIEIDEKFLMKMYDTYVKKEDKQKYTLNDLKNEVEQQIQSIILKQLMPNLFESSINTDDFSNNVAKSYIIETLIYQMLLLDIHSTKDYIHHTLQSAEHSKKEQLIRNYENKDYIFSFSKKIAKDIVVKFKEENINKVRFNEFLGISETYFS